MDTLAKKTNRLVVGWREWLAIPHLGIPAIKAKIDTGARTSAMHAFFVEPFIEHGRRRIRFGIHPLQNRRDVELICTADLAEQRWVSDSGGHKELRYVIVVPIRISDADLPVEITLTDRDPMRFRMLLGRSALRGRFVIDPSRSYVVGRKPKGVYPPRPKRHTEKKGRHPE
jgi:hypothetical protein